MPDDPRVRQLLDELLDTHATPEAVCGSDPDLLPQVRERWRQMCRARAELDALFPPAPRADARRPTRVPDAAVLPSIPGYEVAAVLGMGGMGVVFRARHLRLNRVVALKMALAGAYAGPHERERFQREAEAVAALRHPNVVQIYDIGESDGRPYFTMEFVEGGNLAQKLAGTPQPARAAAALAATLAGAVAAAHDGGIVHRDLKPANVLLTADGTPKVSDFGLARRLGGDAGLTRTGLALGTPSYMAPEQARGSVDAVGTAVDIYALGAILYELLTGRPPFRAETAAETVHQVVNQDPVPPSRLNGKVPRDLETICLKGLRKQPQQRYASAAELADDLGRFLRGEAISARPEGLLSRMARRVRRRPFLWAAVAVATLSTVALIGGGIWTYSERAAVARAEEAERAAVERAADDDLRELVGHLVKSRWADARAALDRATIRIGDRDFPALRARLTKAANDLALAVRLDAIRLRRADSSGGVLGFDRANLEYEAAFAEAGIGHPDEPADVVASRIAASDIRDALVAALDDWTAHPRTVSRQKWLLTVAGQADRRPAGRSLRKVGATAKDLAALAETVSAADHAAATLLGFAKRWKDLGGDPLRLLTAIQQEHPDDFWANLALADELRARGQERESVGFYHAALALRPRTSVIHDSMGTALRHLGRRDDAIDQYRLAVRFDPTAAVAVANLARTLAEAGRREEAVQAATKGIASTPETAYQHAGLHALLGDFRADDGRCEEAKGHYRRALAIDPKSGHARVGLRSVLMREGRFAEAKTAWASAIAADPERHETASGYAEFCLYFGREDDYRRARTDLLDRFADCPEPQVLERVARACLLRPAPADGTRRAAALIDRALSADKSRYPAWAHSYFLLAKALAEYRSGRFESAATLLAGPAGKVLHPAPRLLLAMVRHRQDKPDAARLELAEAASFDWSPTKADTTEAWIYHALRREAEAMILPNLPALLDGTERPRGINEQLALIDHLVAADRARAAARLYADIFAAVPKLADDPGASLRYHAARASARAGRGLGADADDLAESERARLRQQGRKWLRADFDALRKLADADPVKGRPTALRALTHWRDDRDWACVRDAAELEKLPAAEQKEWRALWDDVAAAIKRYEPVQ